MHCNILAGTLGTVAFMLLGAHANAADFSATFSGFEEIGGLGTSVPDAGGVPIACRGNSGAQFCLRLLS